MHGFNLRAVILMGLVGLTCSAAAADNSWTGTVSGLYSNPASPWSLGTVPTAADDVFITNTIGASIVITNNMLATTNASLTIFNTVAGNVKHTLLLSNNVSQVTGATLLGSNAVVQFGIGTLGSASTFSNGSLTLVDNAALSFNSGSGVSTLNVAGEFVNGSGTFLTNATAGGFARLLLASGSSSLLTTNAGTIRFLLSNAGGAGDTGLVVQVGTGAGGLNTLYNTGTIHTFIAGGSGNNTRVAVLSNQLVNAGSVIISNATAAVGATNIFVVTGSGSGAAVTNEVAGTIKLVNTSTSGGLRNLLTAGGDLVNAGTVVGESTSVNGTNQVFAGNFRNAVGGVVVATNTGVLAVQAAGIVNDGLMLATNTAQLLLTGPVAGSGVFKAGPGTTINFANGGSLDFGTSLAFAGGTVILQGAFQNSQVGAFNSVGTMLITNGQLVQTEDFFVGQNVGNVSTLTVANAGILHVTNSTGTARLVVGEAGRGTLNLNPGGELFVNQLLATNNVAFGVTNSFFNFNGGTLTTSNAPNALASSITIQSNSTTGSASPIGNYYIMGSWNMLGGTNLMNMLYVNPGAVLGYIYFGGNTGQSSGNTITVHSNAVWNVLAGNISVQGSNNTIDVLDGGQVRWQSGISLSGVDNVIRVTGTGSVLSASSAYNGAGVRSALIVSNGGSAYFTVGLSPANGSSVIITGPGSVVTNTGNMFIGLTTSSNTVTVADGGLLVVNSIAVGAGGGQFYTNNGLVVTGPGSTVTNKGSLNLGDNGATIGSYVVISNGARIVNSSGVIIGNRSDSTNNTIVVTGTNSVLTSGGGMNAGYQGIFGGLTIADGGIVVNGAATIGGFAGARNNTVLVTDPGSAWTNTSTLIIGNTANTIGNSLIVSNGGALFSGNLTVGNAAGASNNSYQLIGLGAGVTSSNGAIVIGSTASGFNTMTVTNANVQSFGLTVGSASSNNFVTVHTNSLWNMTSGQLTVGSAGVSNSLTVNGGRLTNVNILTVGGAGGFHNDAVIRGGAKVSSITGYIGNGGNSNTLLVTDPGTSWIMVAPGGSGVGVLHVGAGTGAFNSMVISNGAFVFAGETLQRPSTTVGYGPGGNNLLTVTGNGSVLSNLFDIEIGRNSHSNSLVIADGGLAIGQIVQVGSVLASRSNNSVIVTDPNSVLHATVNLRIGSNVNGVANSVLISNGATLRVGLSGFEGRVDIGGGAGGSQNTLTVVDSSASNGLITVGSTGGGLNTLTVQNSTLARFQGATSGGLAIGSGSSNNTVNVLGDATLWNFGGGAVTVGSGAATGNVLTVTGGVLTNAGLIAVGAGAGSGNTLTLTNAALWGNGLTVGAAGSGNAAQIFAGGLLDANSLVTTNTDNSIVNTGGIYQFSTGSPFITNASGPGSIVLDGGVISFRAVTTADVYGNWGGGNQLTNISFAGNNTFRLNAATNSATIDQTYTFDTGLGATNYTRLEMISGQTAYRNGAVTIGGGGTFLASNTLAAITGTFTNHGTAEIVDATVDFQSALHVAGTLTLRNGFVTGSAAKTIAGTLRGNGTVVGDATITGNLSPGLSLGTLVFSNNLTLAGSYQAEFGDGGNDQLIVVGDLTLAGATLDLTVVGGLTGEAYVIANYGDLFGTFSVTTGMPVGYKLDYNYTGANQIAIVVVPEPGSLTLVALGLIVLGIIYHYRRARL